MKTSGAAATAARPGRWCLRRPQASSPSPWHRITATRRSSQAPRFRARSRRWPSIRPTRIISMSPATPMDQASLSLSMRARTGRVSPVCRKPSIISGSAASLRTPCWLSASTTWWKAGAKASASRPPCSRSPPPPPGVPLPAGGPFTPPAKAASQYQLTQARAGMALLYPEAAPRCAPSPPASFIRRLRMSPTADCIWTATHGTASHAPATPAKPGSWSGKNRRLPPQMCRTPG
jgi:hypothetical protein